MKACGALLDAGQTIPLLHVCKCCAEAIRTGHHRGSHIPTDTRQLHTAKRRASITKYYHSDLLAAPVKGAARQKITYRTAYRPRRYRSLGEVATPGRCKVPSHAIALGNSGLLRDAGPAGPLQDVLILDRTFACRHGDGCGRKNEDEICRPKALAILLPAPRENSR